MGVESEPYIVDDWEGGIFRVNRRAFTDPEILEKERERLFDRSWIYVGHESEVSAPGDFQSRNLGTRSLILVRGTDGEVRVFLNTCRHRGAQVCRERCGNQKSFQCFYHGWTYSNEGQLIGVPGEEAYGPAFDRSALGLGRPPHTESYRGFVFVSFDPGIDKLEEYLADAREYLDLVVDQAEAGMEITGGTQRYGIRANWKLLCENSIDGYHGAITHARYMRFLAGSG